jgi:hypothetical protein
MNLEFPLNNNNDGIANIIDAKRLPLVTATDNPSKNNNKKIKIFDFELE